MTALERVWFDACMGKHACSITEILLVCDCGEVKTKTLDGEWTLEQLRVGTSKTDKDFLGKLGVKF